MNYQEACNIFRRVSNFYLEHERSRFERVASPLFEQFCGSNGFGRLTVTVGSEGVLDLSIRHEKDYIYTTESNFYPGVFPVVYQELRTPEDLAVILSNPRNYGCGSFYSSFVPLLLELESLLKEVIEGKGIPYSFSLNFKNGKPDYMFFSVNGDPWGMGLDSSTLETIELIKSRYLASRTNI